MTGTSLEHTLRQALQTRTLLMPAPPPEELRERLEILRRCLDTLPETAGPGAVLLVGRGANARGRPLTGLTRLGSAPDNEVVLDAKYVSRRHAQLRRDGPDWVLEDVASTNGTHVNGHRITRQILRDGDVLQLGEATLLFLRPLPAAASDSLTRTAASDQSTLPVPPVPRRPGP